MQPKSYTKNPPIYRALQLTWDNWQDIRAFVDVGKLSDGQPEGCYLDINGKDIDLRPLPPNAYPMLGLRIPGKDGVRVAQEGEFIVKKLGSIEILIIKESIFWDNYTLNGE